MRWRGWMRGDAIGVYCGFVFLVGVDVAEYGTAHGPTGTEELFVAAFVVGCVFFDGGSERVAWSLRWRRGGGGRSVSRWNVFKFGHRVFVGVGWSVSKVFVVVPFAWDGDAEALWC